MAVGGGNGWWWLAASHPPPNLPLEGGRDELGRGGEGVLDVASVPACAGMTERGAGMVEARGSCLRRNDGRGRGFSGR